MPRPARRTPRRALRRRLSRRSALRRAGELRAVGDTVLFRTHPGTKLDALQRRPVAFQIDSIDEAHRAGWSVLVQGIAHEASPHDLVDTDDPEPWAEAGPHWIQVVPRFISGRRFQLDDGLDPR